MDSPRKLLRLLLRASIIGAVLAGNFTGWGLAVILAALCIPFGLRHPGEGSLLVAYGIVSLPLLLSPSARAWAGVHRRS